MMIIMTFHNMSMSVSNYGFYIVIIYAFFIQGWIFFRSICGFGPFKGRIRFIMTSMSMTMVVMSMAMVVVSMAVASFSYC